MKTLLSTILVLCLCQSVFGQLFELPYEKSNYKYSEFSMMFTRTAGVTSDQFQNFSGSFAWNPESESRSTVYYSTLDQYQETFLRRGDWIVVEGWSTSSPGIIDNYFLKTSAAKIYINGKWLDITAQFKDGPHPYALENLPAHDYSLWVVADVIQYRNGVQVAQSSLTWYVSYSKPQIYNTVHFAPSLGIMQSEVYSSFPYQNLSQALSTQNQAQVMCYQKGYACWRTNTAGTVDGVKSYWNW